MQFIIKVYFSTFLQNKLII